MWKGNPLGCSLPVALEDDDVGSGKIGADGASVLLARTWRCEELVSETREKVESKALSRSRTSLFRIVRSAHTFHAKLSLQNVQFFDRAKEWMLPPSEMFCATSISLETRRSTPRFQKKRVSRWISVFQWGINKDFREGRGTGQ